MKNYQRREREFTLLRELRMRQLTRLRLTRFTRILSPKTNRSFTTVWKAPIILSELGTNRRRTVGKSCLKESPYGSCRTKLSTRSVIEKRTVHYGSRDKLSWATSKRLAAPFVKLPTSLLNNFSSIPRMFAATLTFIKSVVAASFS